MSKHTPGPWECHIQSATGHAINALSVFDVYQTDGNGNGDGIACRLPGDPESDANARLIAAAPESHELNVGVLGVIETLGPDCPEILARFEEPLRAAIARVTLRSGYHD
jgi:hypothetical protein